MQVHMSVHSLEKGREKDLMAGMRNIIEIPGTEVYVGMAHRRVIEIRTPCSGNQIGS